MGDYLDLGEGLVIDEDTGEVVEGGGENLLALLVHRRHDAKTQEDEWKAAKQALDRSLRKYAGDGFTKAVFDEIVLADRGGRYDVTDNEKVVAAIEETTSNVNDAYELLEAFVRCAKGFSKTAIAQLDDGPLRGDVSNIYDRATETKEKRHWFETDVVRKPAPRRKP
jgi:hypothetical protein